MRAQWLLIMTGSVSSASVQGLWNSYGRYDMCHTTFIALEKKKKKRKRKRSRCVDSIWCFHFIYFPTLVIICWWLPEKKKINNIYSTHRFWQEIPECYTALCNGVISHGSPIWGIQVLADHKCKNKRKQNVSTIFVHWEPFHAYLFSRSDRSKHSRWHRQLTNHRYFDHRKNLNTPNWIPMSGGKWRRFLNLWSESEIWLHQFVGLNPYHIWLTEVCNNSFFFFFFFTVLDPCGSNPCGNAGVCNSNLTHYTCNCTEGFTGINCEIGKTCEDRDVGTGMWVWAYGDRGCGDRGCGDKGCRNVWVCNSNSTHYAYVNCTEGFTGINCEIGKACGDRDVGTEDVGWDMRTGMLECGVCNSKLIHYTCNCTEGFIGTNCEIGKTCEDRGVWTEDVGTGDVGMGMLGQGCWNAGVCNSKLNKLYM